MPVIHQAYFFGSGQRTVGMPGNLVVISVGLQIPSPPSFWQLSLCST